MTKVKLTELDRNTLEEGGKIEPKIPEVEEYELSLEPNSSVVSEEDEPT